MYISFYILVPSKLLKHQWNNEIIKYIPEMIDYIKILTYKSMYNKVLGEKKINIDENTLKTYKDYSNKRWLIGIGAKVMRFLGLENRLFR